MELIRPELSEPAMQIPFNVLEPGECKERHPQLSLPTWVYRYQHPTKPWQLCISTQARPHSEQFSLGGFRITPKAIADEPGYDHTNEAIGLAHGMGKKVAWSKLLNIAGPLALPRLDHLVGGKCVLLPTEDARVGHSNDRELLDFAIQAMKQFESQTGIFLITGQDLGHGTMSDGSTYSCNYLNQGFPGSILADTSKPTGEGNFTTMCGLLGALDMPIDQCRIGLIGCGNIGEHILRRLREANCEVEVLEVNPTKVNELRRAGIQVYEETERNDFLKRPLHAIAINANQGSLDTVTIDAICKNDTLRVITGCENLIMADADGAKKLAAAHKLYCPPEICGMMGFLTATEDRLAGLLKLPFEIESLFEAAKPLEQAAERVGRLMLNEGCKPSFEEAVRRIFAN